MRTGTFGKGSLRKDVHCYKCQFGRWTGDYKTTVVMVCRRVYAGEKERETIQGPGTCEVMPLDLGDLSSVRAFADMFLEKHKRLDTLVNNAGLVALEYS